MKVDAQAPEAAPERACTCGKAIPRTSKTGRCATCAAALVLERKGHEVPTDTPRSRAEAFVDAWVRGDYERDDVNPSFMSERSVEAMTSRLADLLAGQEWPAPMALHPKAEKWLANGIVTAGTPREASPVVDGEPNQRAALCVAYNRCAAVAAEKGWERWSCRDCDGPGVASAKQGLRPGEAPRADLTPLGNRRRLTLVDGRTRKGRMRKHEDKGWG